MAASSNPVALMLLRPPINPNRPRSPPAIYCYCCRPCLWRWFGARGFMAQAAATTGGRGALIAPAQLAAPNWPACTKPQAAAGRAPAQAARLQLRHRGPQTLKACSLCGRGSTDGIVRRTGLMIDAFLGLARAPKRQVQLKCFRCHRPQRALPRQSTLSSITQIHPSADRWACWCWGGRAQGAPELLVCWLLLWVPPFFHHRRRTPRRCQRSSGRLPALGRVDGLNRPVIACTGVRL
jgi:hypothetical protein